MRLLFVLLLVGFSAAAQKIPLELRIDSVTADDSNPVARQFVVKYHLTNLTDRKLYVVIDSSELITSTRASLSPRPYYKIYQKDEFIEVDDILSNQLDFSLHHQTNAVEQTAEEKEQMLKKHLKESMDIDVDSARAAYAVSEEKGLEYVAKKHRKAVAKMLMELKPKETREFSKTLYWNRNRYYSYEENEYYLEEHEPYFIDLTLVLMNERVHSALTEDEFLKVEKDNGLVEGVFTSNRVGIDLGNKK